MKNKILFLIIATVIVASLIFWLKPSFQNDVVDKPSEELKSEGVLVEQQATDEQKQRMQQVKFDKFSPNTEWKDKSLNFNGKELHYKFGDGNPAETALMPEDYLAKGEKDGTPYVTPEAEKNLYDFLADDDLAAVLDKCENYRRQNTIKLNPNIPIDQLDFLLTPSDFDIENLMILNTETGRKEIDQFRIDRISEFLNLLSNPMTGTEFGDKCAGTAYSQSIERIKNNFSSFSRSYVNTGEGIPASFWQK